jgi:hypothetical protein
MRLESMLIEVYKAQHNLSPSYISEMFSQKDTGYSLHREHQLEIVNRRTKSHGISSFTHTGAILWNRLPNSVKHHTELKNFKSELSNIDITLIDDARVTS